jgi:hypothetical protein
MPKPKYKKDDRVDGGACLGWGTVVETNVCGQHWLYNVLWDKTPPMEYNMGTNPSVWFEQGVTAKEMDGYV